MEYSSGMELVSPAGNLEKLKACYLYGADAAYIGIKGFSLRMRADNFHQEEYEEIRRIKGDKKLYAALNIYFHQKDLKVLEEEMDYLARYPLDGLIVSDMGIISLLYLCNIGVGVIEAIPDNIPFVGNLDEAGAAVLLLMCLRYFGIDLTKILEKTPKTAEKRETNSQEEN